MQILRACMGLRRLGVVQTACNDVEMKLLCGEIVSQMWRDMPYDYVMVDHSDLDDISKYAYLASLPFPGAVVLDVHPNPGHQQGWANAVTEGWRVGQELGWDWILYLSGNTIPIERGLKERFDRFERSGFPTGWPPDAIEDYFGGAYGLVSIEALNRSQVLVDPEWMDVGGQFTEPLLTFLFKKYGVACKAWTITQSGIIWHFRRPRVADLIQREGIRGIYADQVRVGTERFLFHPQRKVGHYYK